MIFTKELVDKFYTELKDQQKGKHMPSRYDLYDLFSTINVINGKRNQTAMIQGEQLSEYKVNGFVKECIVPWYVSITGDYDTEVNYLSSAYSNEDNWFISYMKNDTVIVTEEVKQPDGTLTTVEKETKVVVEKHARFLDPEEFARTQRRIYRGLNNTLDSSSMESVTSVRKAVSLSTDFLKKMSYHGDIRKPGDGKYFVPVALDLQLFKADEFDKKASYSATKRFVRWVEDTVK